jgi:phosphonopyruvate decarboxylase
MHMGAVAAIGAANQKNLRCVVLNNSAHESVGGMPTCAERISIARIAAACGFPSCASASTLAELDEALQQSCGFIEAKCSLGSRGDLGRPGIAPMENKNALMRHLS